MTAIVGIVSRHIPINKPNKSKLSLYNPLHSLLTTISKQMYISNKTEHFVIKVGVIHL